MFVLDINEILTKRSILPYVAGKNSQHFVCLVILVFVQRLMLKLFDVLGSVQSSSD